MVRHFIERLDFELRVDDARIFAQLQLHLHAMHEECDRRGLGLLRGFGLALARLPQRAQLGVRDGDAGAGEVGEFVRTRGERGGEEAEDGFHAGTVAKPHESLMCSL